MWESLCEAGKRVLPVQGMTTAQQAFRLKKISEIKSDVQRSMPGRDQAGFKSPYPVPPNNRWGQYSYPRSLYTEGKKHWKPENLPHFFESQRKQTCKAPFSDKMCPEEPKQPGNQSRKDSHRTWTSYAGPNMNTLTSTTGATYLSWSAPCHMQLTA